MNRGAWSLTGERVLPGYRRVAGAGRGGPAQEPGQRPVRLRTPDAFWKVVVRGDGGTIAWTVPNTQDATQAKLDSCIVSADIEKLTGEKLPVTGDARTTKQKGSWVVPIGCDKG